MKALIATSLLAALIGAPAYAACTYPKAPAALPDGNTATKEEMIEAQKAVKAYNGEMEAYLSCIKLEHEGVMTKEGANLTPERKLELEKMQVQKHNAAIDELEAVAARFNEQVRVFNSKKKKS